jgi:phosphatidylglycerophosphate synthase
MPADASGEPSAMARRPLKTRSAVWPRALAQRLIDLGLRPNQVSLLSILFSALAGCCFLLAGERPPATAATLLVLAALMIQLRLLCNLLDGLMAVEGGLKSKTGDLYNDLPDRVSDVITLLCVGYSLTGWSWGPLMGWTASLLAVLTAYIRLLGGASGATQHFIGPMAKQQRMGLLTVAAILAAGEKLLSMTPIVLPLALILIAAGSIVTSVRRLLRVSNDLNSH